MVRPAHWSAPEGGDYSKAHGLSVFSASMNMTIIFLFVTAGGTRMRTRQAHAPTATFRDKNADLRAPITRPVRPCVWSVGFACCGSRGRTSPVAAGPPSQPWAAAALMPSLIATPQDAVRRTATQLRGMRGSCRAQGTVRFVPRARGVCRAQSPNRKIVKIKSKKPTVADIRRTNHSLTSAASNIWSRVQAAHLHLHLHLHLAMERVRGRAPPSRRQRRGGLRGRQAHSVSSPVAA
jgi:hypothetical protein